MKSKGGALVGKRIFDQVWSAPRVISSSCHIEYATLTKKLLALKNRLRLHSLRSWRDRPFAASYLRGTKKPCWKAKDTLGLFKNRELTSFKMVISFFCFRPVRRLLSSVVVCTTWISSCKGPTVVRGVTFLAFFQSSGSSAAKILQHPPANPAS